MKSSLQCFLIDDDLDDQEIFLMALRDVDPGIHCTVTGDPVEAVDRLSRDTIPGLDFIFIDVNMPKMNGLQCLTALRQFAHLASSKVWMYSTSAAPSITEQCQKAGSSGFLVKPNGLDQLVAALRQILLPQTEKP